MYWHPSSPWHFAILSDVCYNIRYVKLRVVHASGMPETFSPPPRVSDPDMHHGTGSLTSGFLWSRWREKRSRYSQRMRNVQIYVSGKRSMGIGLLIQIRHLHVIVLRLPNHFIYMVPTWLVVLKLVWMFQWSFPHSKWDWQMLMAEIIFNLNAHD